MQNIILNSINAETRDRHFNPPTLITFHSIIILLMRHAGSHSSILTACLAILNNLITNYMDSFCMFNVETMYTFYTTLMAVGASHKITLMGSRFWDIDSFSKWPEVHVV